MPLPSSLGMSSATFAGLKNSSAAILPPWNVPALPTPDRTYKNISWDCTGESFQPREKGLTATRAEDVNLHGGHLWFFAVTRYASLFTSGASRRDQKRRIFSKFPLTAPPISPEFANILSMFRHSLRTFRRGFNTFSSSCVFNIIYCRT